MVARLVPKTAKQVIKILHSHGFVLARVAGSHHIFLHDSEKRIVTVPVHRGTLPTGTLLSILKQAGIDRDDLYN